MNNYKSKRPELGGPQPQIVEKDEPIPVTYVQPEDTSRERRVELLRLPKGRTEESRWNRKLKGGILY